MGKLLKRVYIQKFLHMQTLRLDIALNNPFIRIFNKKYFKMCLEYGHKGLLQTMPDGKEILKRTVIFSPSTL